MSNIQLKECKYYSTKDNYLECALCPHNCKIMNEKTGLCNSRINKNGKLYSLTWGKPVSISIDPIEKKPLFHFYPKENILSVGTFGCNLKCKFCQNHDISQADVAKESEKLEILMPKEIINLLIQKNLKLIAFTYNEPIIFYEYMLDIAKLAKDNNIKCVIVSNGFINKEPLIELCKYIDAANIDLKSFDNVFYQELCSAKLNPVLETIKILKENKIHVELTNLIISGKNDSLEQIELMAKWIKDNVGENTVLHLSRAFPMYKLNNMIPTPLKTLLAAQRICKKYLNFVFLGNVNSENITFCPKCGSVMIKRNNYSVEIIKTSCCGFTIQTQ